MKRARVARGLAWRIVGICVICALVGVAGAVVATVAVPRRPAEILAADSLRGLIAGDRGEACAADPSQFRWETPSGGHVGFYSREEVQNGEVPDLEPSLAAVLLEGREMGKETYFGDKGGGAWIADMGIGGPCAVYFARWPTHTDMRLGVLAFVLIVVLAAAVAAGLVGFFVGTRPVLRRLEAVSEAASAVGVEGRYHSASILEETRCSPPDELTTVSTALDEAHTRLVRDRELLLSRQRALEQHLSDVAHDVKTPLTSLFMGLEGLLRDVEDPEIRERLGAALEDAVYLESLTQNLHLWTRFEQELSLPEESQRRAVDLNSVAARVTRRYRVVGRQRGVGVDAAWPEAPTLTPCDETMAEQVLSNLVQNGVMYGKEGGQVVVIVDKNEDGFELRVEDDGPGVESEALDQLTARQRAPVGHGLGLAIVNEICHRFGWELRFEHATPGLRVVIAGPLHA